MLLKKGIYPNEYMEKLKKNTKKSLPKREEFYSNPHMEYIKDLDYMDAEKVCNLCLKSDKLLLADVFENFRKT